MQWVTLAVALGCARLSQASHTPTPTPTSTHTPLVDNSEEEVDEPCFEPCTCEVKEGVLHVHCDGRGFTNASQVWLSSSFVWPRMWSCTSLYCAVTYLIKAPYLPV